MAFWIFSPAKISSYKGQKQRHEDELHHNKKKEQQHKNEGNLIITSDDDNDGGVKIFLFAVLYLMMKKTRRWRGVNEEKSHESPHCLASPPIFMIVPIVHHIRCVVILPHSMLHRAHRHIQTTATKRSMKSSKVHVALSCRYITFTFFMLEWKSSFCHCYDVDQLLKFEWRDTGY